MTPLARPPAALARAVGRAVRARALPWVLFVLALGAAAGSFVQWQRVEAVEERRRDVEAVTRNFLRALTNFSAATIERDVAEIERFAAGRFADELDRFFGRDALRAIREARARSEGRIRSVFVQALEDGTASVFAVVDEAVTNRARPAPRRQVIRFDIELIETRQGWRVTTVEILQTPGGGGPPFPG